ncbi:histidine--tRNA ligase [Methylobacillus sp. MM3]|uniref:histidine--tRNA ligase n=1 Tax=Methylobacillus sp. MM3 TaxID=1848039 RepID=UPI0007E156E4|nr:histidine--tRNA ligase [Methylobacillus sp. MM3]OAJ71734.1 histidine--tRNA ligase [Methylobacillus sp. MM3]
MSKTIQAVRGMNDILPADAALWEFFEDTVADWLRAYGYTQIRTPIVESTDLFVRSIGEVTDIVEKEMYSFEDRLNGEQLTLRPEGTASCVRAVIQHNLLYNAPQRLWYKGPMFRHERPQKGRYRQFHQVGVEALGFAGPDMDAEHIVMTARLWKLLGLDDVALEINTLGSLEARARYRSRLISYFEGHADVLDEDAKRRLHSNPLRILDSKNPAMQAIIEAAPKLAEDLDEESRKHFEELQEMLIAAGVPFRINPRLVRGLDYYNATVFEWVTTRLGAQGTVCAGGRYDSLIEQIGGKSAPACGFAMGVERLLALLQEQSFVPPALMPDAYMLHLGEQADRMAILAAEQLRDSGLSVVLHCGGGSFKSQMKKADASGARYAVIIGDDEATAGEVSIKPLRTSGEQSRMNLVQAAEYLAE